MGWCFGKQEKVDVLDLKSLAIRNRGEGGSETRCCNGISTLLSLTQVKFTIKIQGIKKNMAGQVMDLIYFLKCVLDHNNVFGFAL